MFNLLLVLMASVVVLQCHSLRSKVQNRLPFDGSREAGSPGAPRMSQAVNQQPVMEDQGASEICAFLSTRAQIIRGIT